MTKKQFLQQINNEHNINLKLFYIKEKQNGVVTSEENIPENQQRTTSFDKI